MERRICVVFDIDDTLYLERDYVKSGFEAVGRWAEKWLHIQHFADICWTKFLSGSRRSIFNDVLQESGVESNAGLVSALVEIYRTHQPCISLAPDVGKVLKAIRHTASIAVVSDGPATSQSQKVEALGLHSFAAPIILTELLGSGFSKPHSRAFELVSQFHPDCAFVYVADNPVKDFIAPKKLGWATVRVRRAAGMHYAVENGAVIPDHEMCDCSRLTEVLAQL